MSPDQYGGEAHKALLEQRDLEDVLFTWSLHLFIFYYLLNKQRVQSKHLSALNWISRSALSLKSRNLSQELWERRPLIGILVNTIHDQISKFKRIPTILHIPHCIHEKRLIYCQSIQVVAIHTFTNGGNFQHGQSDHKNFIFLSSLKRIKELDSQKI